MSVDSCMREVQRRHEEIARLQKDKGNEATRAADEARKANADYVTASRTSNISSKQNYLNSSHRHQESAAKHQRAVADLEAKIAREQALLVSAQKRLASAQEYEGRQRLAAQERAARDHERRMRSINATLSHHDSLHEVAMTAIERLSRLPESISVLFLAANPLDQPQLRLDDEAREIGRMIRMADHRDSVKFESRWAVQPGDLLQIFNEVKPRIVHFKASPRAA